MEHIINSERSFHQAVESLLTHQILACDTETTGLLETDRLFSVIFASEKDNWYFDFKKLPKELCKQFNPIFADPTRLIIFQNAKFDMRMLGYEGVAFPFPNIEDTEVLGRIEYNQHFEYSLLAQSKRHLPKDFHKDETLADYMHDHGLKKSEFYLVPDEILIPYALQDAKATYHLHRSLSKWITGLPTKTAVRNMERALTPACYQMERRGIVLNHGYTLDAIEWTNKKIDQLKLDWITETKEPLDGTRAQLLRVFTAMGEKIRYTDKGIPSFDEEVLSSFKSQAAWILRSVRFYEKRMSTYYQPFLELASPEGTIHADIRQAGTATGRFSYRSPNLQQLPADEDSAEDFVVRGCFTPRSGYSFLSIDYSQLEYRIMLDYAGEMGMIKRVMAGEDVHQATADQLGITRREAKTINFMILYGGGNGALAADLGISEQAAAHLRQLYFAKLPKVQALINHVMTVAKHRGFVKNWLGRHMYCDNPSYAYAIPNHLIQGSGADVCKLAMIQCHRYLAGKKSQMILQVHDDIVTEMHDDERDIIPHMVRLMESVYKSQNGMRLTVEPQIGKHSLAKRDMEKHAIL